MTDFDFMRRRRTNVRWASRLPGPRLKEASDASDKRGHLGEIIFVGFDGKPIMYERTKERTLECRTSRTNRDCCLRKLFCGTLLGSSGNIGSSTSSFEIGKV